MNRSVLFNPETDHMADGLDRCAEVMSFLKGTILLRLETQEKQVTIYKEWFGGMYYILELLETALEAMSIKSIMVQDRNEAVREDPVTRIKQE